MNEQQRKLIRELAENAEQVADSLRDPDVPISGEDWVTLGWIAEELSNLDWELTREALESGAS